MVQALPSRTTSPPTSGLRRVGFHGRAGTLFGVHLVNVFLTLVTLGVYYAWARRS